MNDVQPSETILKNLKHYLSFKGWFEVKHPNKRIQLLETELNEAGEYGSVALPISLEYRDAGALMNEAARLIAVYEKVPLQKILDRVLHWDRDILRTRLFKVHGNDDTLPLEMAANVISELKEFVGYAAYTHTNPQPFFDKAGAVSGEFAKHCRFAQTFKGSFGITIECPLTVVPELPIEGSFPSVPFERQIFERIANGFGTLRESVEKDSLDPLLASYRTGFSANMCRTLADLYVKADGRRIEYDFAWSPQLVTPCERVWKPIIFEGRAYDAVRIAADELEKVEKYDDSIIEGRIVILKSEMPPGLDEQAEFEHIITMFWEREKGQAVRIRVPLSPQQYIEACDAHKNGRPIRIFGVPEKSGKFWNLTKPHDFKVL